MAKKVKAAKKPAEMVAEAVMDKDTKRTVRFAVGEYGEAISGSLYFSKELVKDIPSRVVIEIVDAE